MVTLETIKTAILSDCRWVDESEVKPEADLQNDLGLDSLDIVCLSIELEIEYADWKTVQDVIDTVDRLNQVPNGQ